MQSITPEPKGRVRGAANETFRSLRIRNFRLFFGGQIVSQAGNWMTLITQTLLVLHLTHNGVAVGLMAAAQFLPVLLFGAWAGVVADRSDKRKLLIGIQTFAMVQSFALAAFAFMDQPPLTAFYLLAVAGGFATVFDNPARRSFVVEMVPEDYVQNAVSLNSALMMGVADGRAGGRRCRHRGRWLRVVIRDRRLLVHRSDRGLLAHAHERAAARAGHAAREGAGARRVPLRAQDP